MISYIEQIRLIIYFIIFGSFLGVTLDTIKYIIKNENIIVRYGQECIYWVILLLIAYLYIVKVQNGFVNIYTIVFYILGFSSYYLLISNSHHNVIDKGIYVFNKYIKNIIIELFYPKEILKFIKRCFKRIKKIKFFSKKA